jgi:hypothetical protein
VFGIVDKRNEISITDIGCKFSRPCMFAMRTRKEMIKEEKSESKLVHYFGVFFVIVGGILSYFELNESFKNKLD